VISQVSSGGLVYAPLSQAVRETSLSEVKALPAQPASALNQSNTNNSLPLNSSASTTDSENETRQRNAKVQQVINQLKARDSEVKAHEIAHLSAAGAYSTGGMSFTYQTGPEGRQYAVGGEVGIDVSAVVGDPQATLQKAMVLYGAALAPAEPSAQDNKVASAAAQMMAQARADIVALSQKERIVESEESAEKDSVSEAEFGDRTVALGSVLESSSHSANINSMSLQNAFLTKNLKTSILAVSSDRNQFDLRVQFPVNSPRSTFR